MNKISQIGFILLVLLLITGCAAPLRMITPAQEPLRTYKVLEFAEIKSEIVGKTDAGILNSILEESIDGILDLKYFDKLLVADTIKLAPKLAEKTIQTSLFNDTTITIAVLKTTLVEYDEGSATLRFFFAPFAGSGKVTLEIEVTNKHTQKLLMKARTTERITGAFSSASDVVGPLKRAIVNFVDDYFIKEKKDKPVNPADQW